MKIQTFSIVVGTQACDGRCPFCVSHTTGFHNLPNIKSGINWQRFYKACQLAHLGGTTTVLFTGKGEPTLYPDQITAFLEQLEHLPEYAHIPSFPLIELQTNAIQIGHLAAGKPTNYQRLQVEHLRTWLRHGLNTIAISTVGINPEHNQKIYCENYPDLCQTVRYLQDMKFSVRLCVMMMKGMIDTPDKLFEVADWCKKNNIAQLTARPIRRPDEIGNTSEEKYVKENELEALEEEDIRDTVDEYATRIMTLMHGNHQAKVYDYNGQNICLSDCLTTEPNSAYIRTLIFYTDGKVFYSWQHDGARLL